ncbi:ATP-binding protein [Kitasatospora indigofera]|uniref:ATP-binding protein n=1 Tax=Kitasatospora indigofera TaxID=67307 RepID=UPI003690DE5A
MITPVRLHDRPDTQTIWRKEMDQLAPQDVALIRNGAVAHCRDIRLAHNRPADDNALDDVALVITELVTNALKHATTPGAPTPMGILLALHRDDVLVVVSDPSTQGPLLDTTVPGLEVGGLGLGLVRTITRDRWGWHPLPFGKAVWAQCPLTTQPTSPNRTEI